MTSVGNPSKKKPHLYIDTNVIQDTIRNRRPTSIYLLERIKDKHITASTSAWTLLELMDISTEYTHVWRRIGQGWPFDEMLRHRYPRNLSTNDLDEAAKVVYDKVYETYIKSKAILLYTLEAGGWDYAFELMGDYNISKGDVVHVATAKLADCNLFVSSDGDLVKLLNDNQILLSCPPNKVKETLESSDIDATDF